ncbi:hypothetical protein L1049_026299 [Liquidambar formosana]|uniref:Uncharacterized protein n=1 Tax=Liquidambar formosana TaxID=63359 RepID=A0AAP0NEH5_LIQFO
MESDDDYQFPLPEEPSPPLHARKLKRLKKAIRVSNDPLVNTSDKSPLMPTSDSSKFEPLESSEALGFNDSSESLPSRSESEGLDGEKGAKRALEFDSADGEFDGKGEGGSGEMGEFDGKGGDGSGEMEDFDGKGGDGSGEMEDFDGKGENGSGDMGAFDGKEGDRNEEMGDEAVDFEINNSEKKRQNLEGFKEKKEKKKKRARSYGDDGKRKATASNKRKAEKERRDHLKQLHAESQRLLRETRDAAFKPVPLVQKPISSVLEKIRQRKLEVSKKAAMLNSNSSIAEHDGFLKEAMMDLDSENISIAGRGDYEFEKVVNEETIAHPSDVESVLDAVPRERSNESVKDLSHENIPSQVALDEESKCAFRAPIDDTQDLFCYSQTSDSKDDLPSEQDDSPPEEVFAPSLLTMNLKLDSAPPDDVSSDEEDNEKENMDPHLHGLVSSPKGDPVKAFVDDEAEEEDDSDNDLCRFQENEEDDDTGDAEELNDLIATEYEEKVTDSEKRHELHQKWLEQQDAAGTDNLMQRLKCGSRQREMTLLEEKEDMEEDEEDFSYEAAEDLVPTNVARMNSRKLKQMIPQMFTDKDDAFLSSDDEETEKSLVKQRLLQKAEEQATFLSPVEDANSREVFGLIKKLNIVPDTKKKAKPSSFFDKLVTAVNGNSFSKSSFIGRVSSNSLPSSHKRGSSTVRSFIFGRDDSNSRSAIAMSEDSSDTIQGEIRPTRTTSAKFSGSQLKTCTQNTKIAAETISDTSLFEILRRSSQQLNQCPRDETVGRTQTVFAAFKLPKKSIKIEGES